MREVELVKQLNARASMTERLTGVKGDGTRLREAADTITRLLKERDEARAKTAIMLGVGDGHGSLFVYGDYDSIKAARAYIFRAEAAEAQVAALTKSKDEAYAERNKLVSFLARLYPSGTMKTDIPGWDAEWHGCVFIDTPQGQMSWHYHDSEAHLFADLPPYQGEWDGHTTEEKYRRLKALEASR